jgi:hypothetical protein
VTALKPKRGALNSINGGIESFSRSLPVFDLWPYRSATLYELRPDGKVVKPGAEGFYQNYRPVGSFPYVTSRKRRWQVILISSFLGFITPVL